MGRGQCVAVGVVVGVVWVGGCGGGALVPLARATPNRRPTTHAPPRHPLLPLSHATTTPTPRTRAHTGPDAAREGLAGVFRGAAVHAHLCVVPEGAGAPYAVPCRAVLHSQRPLPGCTTRQGGAGLRARRPAHLFAPGAPLAFGGLSLACKACRTWLAGGGGVPPSLPLALYLCLSAYSCEPDHCCAAPPAPPAPPPPTHTHMHARTQPHTQCVAAVTTWQSRSTRTHTITCACACMPHMRICSGHGRAAARRVGPRHDHHGRLHQRGRAVRPQPATHPGRAAAAAGPGQGNPDRHGIPGERGAHG